MLAAIFSTAFCHVLAVPHFADEVVSIAALGFFTQRLRNVGELPSPVALPMRVVGVPKDGLDAHVISSASAASTGASLSLLSLTKKKSVVSVKCRQKSERSQQLEVGKVHRQDSQTSDHIGRRHRLP